MSVLTPLIAIALAQSTAIAQPHELSASVVGWEYRGFLSGSEPFVGLELGYRHRLWREPLMVGVNLRSAGLRTGSALPVELGLVAELRAPIGSWDPGVAVEFGWSGLSQVDLSWRGGLPPGAHTQEEERLGPWYVGFAISALRFHLGRWQLSALELQLGATAFPFGTGARTQLGLLKVGVRL